MKTIKILLMLLLGVVATDTFAQGAEMADTFRSEGKIYVVVAIVLIVLAGLVLYLFTLDRKLARLERELREKLQTKPTRKVF